MTDKTKPPLLHKVKFKSDRQEPWTGFLELDGQRIRYLTLDVSIRPKELPIVTISVYARLVEGEIVGATGAIKLIHIDESTLPPKADDTGGCPAGIKLKDD